ncbi:hypothetical protein [Mameliella sediminis]|uniref:hypothetical protein n=1 Tax=Mameliella sediminis TaxID=2836866 RepID=UPI001C4977D9|nr:hypothetical protein [Mameliella sediminis]MBY6116061.1 hypothetical protein [Antarctobacter heliothermus]MBY6146026.1 hypothetical protein [Mameliella alba]MBV7396980.1 hypothetical protein [Mameliella sediminis]MBY6161731.1 hypothetical protein [Mameliella alba]MBY6170201.1 hypothetical protein [Mameliella alba]
MQSDRLIGHAPRSQAFGEKFYATGGTCIGCKGCTGLCQALIEALVVPDMVLGRED